MEREHPLPAHREPRRQPGNSRAPPSLAATSQRGLTSPPDAPARQPGPKANTGVKGRLRLPAIGFTNWNVDLEVGAGPGRLARRC